MFNDPNSLLAIFARLVDSLVHEDREALGTYIHLTADTYEPLGDLESVMCAAAYDLDTLCFGQVD